TIRELLVACRPLPSGQDSTHYVDIGRLHPQAREQLISVLNAGIAGSYVALDSETPDRYLLRPAFFQVIARIISAEQRDGEPIAAAVRYGYDWTDETGTSLTHDLPGEALETGPQP